MAAANAENLDPDEAAAERDRVRQDLEDARRTMRAGWPRAARNLPDRAMVVNREDIYTHLETTLTPRARAFKLIMNRMYAAQIQVPLTPMPANAVQVPRPERQIAQDVHDALVECGDNGGQ